MVMDVLAGFRVVDLTMWAFVPSAGGVLAHWGADVIKVESPRFPDPLRLLDGSLEPGDASWFFKHYSRGKRSLLLDLTTEEGREVLHRLVTGADVFLTSYLPPTRRKLGFDVDDIRAINPDIVYARGTGQGPLGPEAERGGYDGATYWCRGSLAQSTMEVNDLEWPSGMIGHGDGMSGLTLAGGICAALLKRERTGVTSVVDGSLLGTAIWYNGPSIISSGLGRDHMAAIAALPHDAHLPNANTYRTADNRFLILAMHGDHDAEWADLCELLARPELATDPRFSTSAARADHMAEGVALFDEIFASRTLADWTPILRAAKGVWAPVQSPLEIHDDPQTKANGFLREVNYPTGPVRLPVPPIQFDEEAGDPPPSPDFGEHTDEVLAELGYDAEAIDALRAHGVVA
jgi:crotonobetainyl-CoA:carnitine CoA-transferase CaiB-like acyl-CoA transferase